MGTAIARRRTLKRLVISTLIALTLLLVGATAAAAHSPREARQPLAAAPSTADLPPGNLGAASSDPGTVDERPSNPADVDQGATTVPTDLPTDLPGHPVSGDQASEVPATEDRAATDAPEALDQTALPTTMVDLPGDTAQPTEDDLVAIAAEPEVDQQPLGEVPTTELREIYDAFDGPALSSLQSRQDTSDDLVIDELDNSEVPDLTAGKTVLIIDALAEVGAFRRDDDPTVTAAVRTIRDAIPADGLTADGYRSEIRRFSFELRPALETLESDGIEVSPALKRVAASLTPDLLDALDAGETAVLEPQAWLDGLSDLVVRDGAAPEPQRNRVADRQAVMAVVAAVAGLDLDELTNGGLAASEQNGSAGIGGANTEALRDASPLLASGFIGAVIALLLALLVVRRHGAPTATEEPDPATPPKLSITDLLDASRRMTASLDAEEIGPIVMAETRRLVAAEGCIIALRDGKGLTALHYGPEELFEPSVLSDPDAPESCLRRVVETGQVTVMVATDEPVLVEVPMALVAVPIVADGRVAGAMLIVRVSTRPFDRHDVEALEMLAPMVGTALQSAQTHGSATALAETEPLTGLKNRRRLEQDLASLDEEPTVAYIMIDVDHFKTFNDTNGHAAGDEALRRVAKVLEASVRPGDLVYRYGGEEFCMLLPNVSQTGALAVAERVRLAVEAADIPGGESQPNGRVTVSVGVACDGPPEALVERADAALYQAKRHGRNQVRAASMV